MKESSKNVSHSAAKAPYTLLLMNMALHNRLIRPSLLVHKKKFKKKKSINKHLLLLRFVGSHRIPVRVHTSTLYPATASCLTADITTEEEQFLLSPAAKSWESRIPDSCRDLMQESTSSRPVVSSSSMSFCPSMGKDTEQEKEMTLVLV